MTLDAFTLAADRFDPPPQPRSPVAKYLHDPAGFAVDCIDWGDGKGPADYQLRILAALEEHRRVAVRGPHGLGKTTTDSLAILWFALVHDALGHDWKIPTTASVWRQLTVYLWPEIHKWAKRIRWDKLGRPPFTRFELLEHNLKLRAGSAFAVASNDPAAIEGAHADWLMYLFDEAKTIPGETFDAAEGAFSGAGTDTASEAFALATSTPGEPNGRFHDVHKRSAGYEDWHTIHVTLDEVVAAGRVSRDWADQRARQWGIQSAVYQNRVEGEFAASDEDGVIPLAWVELANERWRAWADTIDTGPLYCLGVDVARSGADKTVVARRHDQVITELTRYDKQDTMETAGKVQGILDGTDSYAVVDVLNVGAGVVDRLRELGMGVVAFNASEGTPMRDRSGDLGFTNKRSAAWWNLREMLDPAYNEQLALPPDDRLIGDLTAPHWRVMSGGRVQVESKDDIRKRIGRSTDDGDAVIQAFWPETPWVEVGTGLDVFG